MMTKVQHKKNFVNGYLNLIYQQVPLVFYLTILRKHMPELPKDSRTLLKTPKANCYKLKIMGDGKYCHVGLAAGLIQLLKLGITPDRNCFYLQFNIDGLPLFKSSSTSVWPILCMVVNVELNNSPPFLVGIFCGKEKPSSAKEYMSEFVAETKMLLTEGFIVDSATYTIIIQSFICDAPARAFIKGIKMHSGYSSCEKCTQTGTYDGKVIFTELNAPIRTDAAFHEMRDADHHVHECSIKELNVGCVSQFGLDYMHLVCLGVMKRLLLYWKGPVGPLHVRIGSQLASELSNKLVHAAQFTPVEFARKPRPIKDVLRWKATEYREFLLYLGPVLLKNILQPQYLEHFMLLSVGIMLLVRKHRAEDLINYANELLNLFVQECEQLYGKQCLVYNVHNLIHLAHDAKTLGCLDDFSSFPYENMLGQVKQLVRNPQHPIQQILNRLNEKSCCQSRISLQSKAEDAQCYDEDRRSVVPNGYRNCVSFKRLKLNGGSGTIYINKQGNNYILTKGGPALVRNILKEKSGNAIFVVCSFFKYVTDAFTVPLPSTKLNIYKVSSEVFIENVVPITEIVGKCVCVPLSFEETSFVLFPFLHNH